MTDDSNSTRRAFLKGGAVLAVPLAAAVPTAALAAQERAARLARLEDETAIRALHQSWMRHVNTGASEAAAQLFARPEVARCDEGLCAVMADHAGEADRIDIAADGRSASGRFACTVETASMIPAASTLAQMAIAQGGGLVRATGRRTLSADYVRQGDIWAIAGLAFTDA